MPSRENNCRVCGKDITKIPGRFVHYCRSEECQKKKNRERLDAKKSVRIHRSKKYNNKCGCGRPGCKTGYNYYWNEACLRERESGHRLSISTGELESICG